jgi:hypothetical protein
MPDTPSGLSFCRRPSFIVSPRVSLKLIFIIVFFSYKDSNFRYIGVEGSPPLCDCHPPPRKRDSSDRGGLAFKRACPIFWRFPTAMDAPPPPPPQLRPCPRVTRHHVMPAPPRTRYAHARAVA